MDLHDGDLVARLVDVLVERDQARLVGLDELDQVRHALALAVEPPGLQAIRRDEDERRRHGPHRSDTGLGPRTARHPAL
jgi:hypothetical protein